MITIVINTINKACIEKTYLLCLFWLERAAPYTFLVAKSATIALSLLRAVSHR